MIDERKLIDILQDWADMANPGERDIITDVIGVIEEQAKLDECGHWFDKGSLSCRCSECGCKNAKETNYCPNCGAKMKP